MIKATVVIPVYRVEPWLRACLDSVLSQTLRELEVICVDDASPDGCPAILDEYAQKDPRVSVIHLTENRGQGNGRNLGLLRASGKYVYFLDSDDTIEPDAMEELYRKAEEEELDGIFFDSRTVFESEALARRYASYPAARKGVYPDGPVPGTELFESFIRQGEWTCYVQRQFWKRSFLREEGILFPVRVEHEDEVFAFEAVLAAKRVRYWNRRFFIRRYREKSVMTSPFLPKNFYGYFMDLCYMDRFASERGLTGTAVRRNLARLYEKLVRNYGPLSEKYDLESWFKTPEERNLFWFFRTSQYAYLHYGMLSETLVEQAGSAGRLFLYGAGAIADAVFKALVQKGLVIDGFLVTKEEGNPSAFNGRPVTGLEKAGEPREGDLVILAVTDGYRREIEEELDRIGWKHFYYKD